MTTYFLTYEEPGSGQEAWTIRAVEAAGTISEPLGYRIDPDNPDPTTDIGDILAWAETNLASQGVPVTGWKHQSAMPWPTWQALT